MLTPDFVKVAGAHGVPARRVRRRDAVSDAIDWARRTPGPALLEFRVEREDGVYPMVPSGASLDQMIQRPLHVEG
jgi:acetolactate synthase-1/2/3 large subunit